MISGDDFDEWKKEKLVSKKKTVFHEVHSKEKVRRV
jgi:hypothetical protein